jgi:uncharacterized protein (TIGR00251 family)
MLITVHVKPNARRSQITKQLDDTTYVIDVAAPPVDGKANKELVAFLADHFDIAKSRVVLKRGAGTRIKQIELLI